MRALIDYQKRAVTPDEAVAPIKSGMKVFLHGAAATPSPLVEALARRTDLEDVTLYHLHTTGPAPFADPSQVGRFLSVSLFTGPALRKPIEDGRADFMPIFLSDIPALFTSGVVRLDAALVQLSPPDLNGHSTLGTSVDAARAAVDSAKMLIAEINERMPRTHGHTVVPFETITSFAHSDRPLAEHETAKESEVEGRIGELIAKLVEDGSTIQVGIGSIPDAVLTRLFDKHDLGVHTEMFSDHIVELVDAGVVTNKKKRIHAGRTVASFVLGTRKTYDFVDDNLAVELHPCDRTNDTALIRENDKTVAINSALEVDLTGQVCADSIGHRIYSGIGGQMDFVRGAALSRGGKPILALPATAASGQVSRIVPALKPGAGVVTTRGHVHWVVTEFGAVNLHGMTLRQRAEALVGISHPDFRPELQRAARDIRHFAL
ncbi:MAG: acetyl-CoA hydrolase/transferase family protein [Deltaproteobacteria bacterium]|nr:acetyl-CoA hydrolase/transferase family protein [Deltaproteobacteria bacterium]